MFDNYLFFVVEACDDTACFFAGCLHNTFDGMGTDEIALSRIIVHRVEIDLKDIAVAYKEMFGQTLAEWESRIMLEVTSVENEEGNHHEVETSNLNRGELTPTSTGAKRKVDIQKEL
ncbi:hypothetical protein TCAL_05362 [Tigriopus californicus]|uniref:Annexin n=1 Tax=Tigriopus californicus TaxID=6832 RepID=A0A553NP65_TIGCA|nr:hypothetical protein TCAL_05362 [Tigriopus californicus]